MNTGFVLRNAGDDVVLLPLNAAIRAATEELERSWALALAALAPPAIRVLFRGGGPGTVFLLKMEDDDVVFDLNNIPLFPNALYPGPVAEQLREPRVLLVHPRD